MTINWHQHHDAVEALLGDRAERTGDQPAQTILQAADECDRLRAEVIEGATEIARDYKLYAQPFGAGDLWALPPSERTTVSDVAENARRYEAELGALHEVVRAVLGADMGIHKPAETTGFPGVPSPRH